MPLQELWETGQVYATTTSGNRTRGRNERHVRPKMLAALTGAGGTTDYGDNGNFVVFRSCLFMTGLLTEEISALGYLK